MSLKGKRLALIGGGNMGTALAAGLIASGRMKPSQIFVTDVRPQARRALAKRLKVSVGTDNAEAARRCGLVLLCVKPQQMSEVLSQLKPAVTPRHLVVSIAAGIRTGFIEKGLAPHVPVIRVMPNTPAMLRAGALVYCLGRRARRGHELAAAEVLSAVGSVWKTTEPLMDAVTALSGSGPAYAFLLAECLARAGATLGLPPALADALARQTVYGAGLMLKDSSEPAAALRERVTSPGGTTEAALKVLRGAGVEKIFERALKAARDRGRALAK
jgi:pyrroline-5-carboxylate reductase